MKSNRLTAALAFLMCLGNLSIADEIKGRVASVADGDTITVVDDKKQKHIIRMQGIDAPEKSQEGGMAAKKQLTGIVSGKNVTVTTSGKDKYGREIGKVTRDGADVNREMVKTGNAWHYKKYQKQQSKKDRSAYAQAEKQARAGGAGVWSKSTPEAPWDYRHSGHAKSSATGCTASAPCTGKRGGRYYITSGGKKRYKK